MEINNSDVKINEEILRHRSIIIPLIMFNGILTSSGMMSE